MRQLYFVCEFCFSINMSVNILFTFSERVAFSKFSSIDEILQPYVKNLKSYVKDTTDFLRQEAHEGLSRSTGFWLSLSLSLNNGNSREHNPGPNV